MSDPIRLIEVCAECMTASCWHGEFMCEKSRSAGTRRVPRSELDKLHLEHPDNYSDRKLREICGE